MVRKGFSILPILLLVLTVVCAIMGAPVKQHVPPDVKSVEIPSHISKGDVMLLKEKLEELEADLDQLEPVVPAETTVDDEEDEGDIEPVDETDEDEDIEPPAETVPANQLPVQQQPPETVHAENEVEINPVVEQPVEAEDDDDEDDDEGEEEGDVAGEGEEGQDGEETDGEWGEEVAVNEGIIPYRNPEDDDLYLRKLIVQALTVLYRKDAERIDRMLQEYENQLLEDDVFEENFAPAPQDLKPGNEMGKQKLEAGAFADRPFTNDELHQEEVLQALAAKKRQDMNAAEETLLSDMQTFEGEGITLDEIINDLEDKKNNHGQGLPVEPRDDETDDEEEALFGKYREDDVDDVDKEEATVVDEDPALSLQELQKIGNEGVNDVEHEVDDNAEEEEDADDLLMELMSNLNTSLKNFQEHKAALPK